VAIHRRPNKEAAKVAWLLNIYVPNPSRLQAEEPPQEATPGYRLAIGFWRWMQHHRHEALSHAGNLIGCLRAWRGRAARSSVAGGRRLF